MRNHRCTLAWLAAAASLVAWSTQTPAPLEPLGDDPLWGDVSPVVSPDGRRVAFASSRAGHLEVFIMDLESQAVSQRTGLESTTHPSSWSPDGAELLVESHVTGDRELYALPVDGELVRTADGAPMRRLTNRPGRDSHPSWMPDGTRVVFFSERDGNSDIYSMDRNGGDVRRLTSHPEVDLSPVPSPDGSKIVFASARTGDRELFIMNADGSDQTRLTRSPDWDGWPKWSPDGTRIAFTSMRDVGDHETYIINVDGTNTRRLTTTPGLDYQHDWLPDGRHLVIRSDDGGRAGLVVLAVDDLTRRRITNPRLSHFARVARAEGPRVALARLAASAGGPAYFHDRELSNLILRYETTEPALVVELLEQGVAAYPTSARLLVALGDAYLAGGQKEASVSAFERAVRLSGEGAVERLRRARAD